MTEAESTPVLSFLIGHIARPEFSYRFHWTEGAIALWDNRCTQHLVLNGFHGDRRQMNRVTILGNELYLGLQPDGTSAAPVASLPRIAQKYPGNELTGEQGNESDCISRRTETGIDRSS
jgi:hypothetical protein